MGYFGLSHLSSTETIGAAQHCSSLDQNPPLFHCIDWSREKTKKPVVYVLCPDCPLTGTAAWKVMPIL